MKFRQCLTPYNLCIPNPLSIHMVIRYLWCLSQASQSDRKALRVGSVSHCIASGRLKFQLSLRRQNNINRISFPPLLRSWSNILLVMSPVKTDSVVPSSAEHISYWFQSYQLPRSRKNFFHVSLNNFISFSSEQNKHISFYFSFKEGLVTIAHAPY